MEEPKVLVDSPCVRGVNVGELPLGVVEVGDVVEDPRLPEGGDDPLPRRSPLVGVEDCGEVVSEDFPTLGPDTLGLLSLVLDGLIESVEVDDVARLIPREAFQSAKNAQVEGLGKLLLDGWSSCCWSITTVKQSIHQLSLGCSSPEYPTNIASTTAKRRSIPLFSKGKNFVAVGNGTNRANRGVIVKMTKNR